MLSIVSFCMSSNLESSFSDFSYIESVKANPALFEMIGAEAAGYCETISGRDYVGQLMLWNAFPSVTSAIVGASKYDPSKAPADMASQREFKYGATWAPLKPFPRLDPGYERCLRICRPMWCVGVGRIVPWNRLCPLQTARRLQHQRPRAKCMPPRCGRAHQPQRQRGSHLTSGGLGEFTGPASHPGAI